MDSIKVINFGIFESVANSKKYYSLYIIGSREYDIDNADWACNEDFVPSDKYLLIKDKLISELSWREFSDLTIKTLNKVLNNNELIEFFYKFEYIFTGFDDGELVEIKIKKS